MTERNKAVPAVYLILKRGGDILLMRRYNTGYYDGWYSLPAGHVEYKEMPIEALIRESEEEIGIKLRFEDISFVHLMCRESHDVTGDRLDMFYLVNVDSNVEPVNTEPEKCDDLYWCKLDNLPVNMVQNVRQAVEKSLKGVFYSELKGSELEVYTQEYENYCPLTK